MRVVKLSILLVASAGVFAARGAGANRSPNPESTVAKPSGAKRPIRGAPAPSSTSTADASAGPDATSATSAGVDYEALLAQSETDLRLARDELSDLREDLADIKDGIIAINAEKDEFRRVADEINRMAGKLNDAQREVAGLLADERPSDRPDRGPLVEELRMFITQVCKDPAVANCSSAEAAVGSLAADEEREALRRQKFKDRLEEFNKTLSNLAADLDDVTTGTGENLS